MQWLVENWEMVGAALLLAHAAASIVTAITPTPKDDVAVAKFYRAIEVMAGLIGHAKEGPPPNKPELKAPGKAPSKRLVRMEAELARIDRDMNAVIKAQQQLNEHGSSPKQAWSHTKSTTEWPGGLR